jgi:hypothetical protein
MDTLHIAPGHSAGGSLMQAIRAAGRPDAVLPFPDDYSCGPIEPDDPSTRASWWGQFYDDMPVGGALQVFWDRVTTFEGRLVVWFGRHAASELAFFLAWADRLGERSYHIVDIPGRQLPFTRRDGSVVKSGPVQVVALFPPDALRSLLGQERPVTPQERDEWRQHWRRLRRENAAFRVVTEAGLVSASIDHFDPLLLAQATSEWRKVARVVGDAMGYSLGPYIQVGDLMLLTRIVALVGEGKLLAEGDPLNMSSRIRLPE